MKKIAHALGVCVLALSVAALAAAAPLPWQTRGEVSAAYDPAYAPAPYRCPEGIFFVYGLKDDMEAEYTIATLGDESRWIIYRDDPPRPMWYGETRTDGTLVVSHFFATMDLAMASPYKDGCKWFSLPESI